MEFVIEVTSGGRGGWVEDLGTELRFTTRLGEATRYTSALDAACVKCYVPDENDPTIVELTAPVRSD